MEERDLPSDLVSQVQQQYCELVEAVANVDEELCELFISDQHPSPCQLKVCKDSHDLPMISLSSVYDIMAITS